MNNFNIVFKFEFSEMIKKKSVLTTTIILCIFMFIGASIPTISKMFNKADLKPAETSENVTPSLGERNDLGFVLSSEVSSEKLSGYLALQSVNVYESKEALKQAIEDKEITYGFVIDSLTSYTMLVNDKGMYSFEEGMIQSALQSYASDEYLSSFGIDTQRVHEAQSIKVEGVVEQFGKDASKGFFVSYAIMFIMYMLILFFGQSVATSVAREKDSRTMELLITSTKPKALILGKVAALGCVGLLQIGVILLTLVLGILVNKVNYPPMILAILQDTMTPSVFLLYLLFSVLGYALYLFIYASLGSLVSKVEDVNSAVTPITMLFVVAFVIASISLQMPQSSLAKISSYIPFVSLFTMPIRVLLTSVSWIEILISSLVMIATTIIVAKLSIYIYRYGSLNYGNKLSMKDIFKNIKKEKNGH
ncbi:ABC transporter permease [Erysipelothrix inopinata]|uniref:ABC transporter permease n=1 Tax=Erysipelothrix inopinata TaxID=225084 RepID=A0A7G9RXQ3_9FIRM|nr:ABC transporter permease [Erysipelothrix inopinata]QNN60378.1 ABC transporter permease [Erysipelothrix inopinata]